MEGCIVWVGTGDDYRVHVYDRNALWMTLSI
jgi:hypothetical protein